jgi:hypothetical protein
MKMGWSCLELDHIHSRLPPALSDWRLVGLLEAEATRNAVSIRRYEGVDGLYAPFCMEYLGAYGYGGRELGSLFCLSVRRMRFASYFLGID